MKKLFKLAAGILIGGAAVIGVMGYVATRANAAPAPLPTISGGTSTSVPPTSGQVLIGNSGGGYTPAYILCAGTCSVATSSGGITITGTGVSTNTGNWAGTWQLYHPTDFLASSTQIVNTVNGSAGTVTITSSTLGVVWPTVNGNKATNYNITATNGVTSTISGATTTVSVSLNNGSAVTCSANQFLNTISATGTAQCGSVTFPSTYTFSAGSGISITQATSSSNTTTTVTLNINNGSVQTCTAGQDANSITTLGIISCNIAVHTIAGVNTSTISFVAAGGTSITTSTNSITFTTVSTSTANTWTALQTYTQGATINGPLTIGSTTNAIVVTNGSGQVSGFAGSNCSAGNAPTGISATGTVQNCVAYLQGNQSVTLTISGDATGTASGATAINDSIQVTGLLGKSLPSLATGTLYFTGGAWTINNNILSSYNVTGGTGISVSTTTNSATVTNTGVTSFNTQTGAATYTVNAGTGLSVTTSTTSSTLTVNLNNGTLQSCANRGVTGLTATGTIVCSADVFSIAGISTGTISIVAGTNITISTTTNSITINSTGGGGSNNATGTIDETALFNATNTLISSQPNYVPSNFATAGCAGSSTATTLNGCIQAIITQDVGLGYSAATIFITHNVAAANYPAPINLATNNFPVQLECTAGVQIVYGGTTGLQQGAIIFNYGNPTGHPVIVQAPGCDFMGHSTWIAAGNTNTATTTGVYFGGNQGAVGIVFAGNLNGFGRNYVVGQNSYMVNYTGTSSGGNGGVITTTGTTINGSTTISGVTNPQNFIIGGYISGSGIPNSTQVTGESATAITISQAATSGNTTTTLSENFGSLAEWDLANNSGERALAVGGSYTDPGNSSATNALYVANGAVADVHILNNSLDDVHIYCGSSDGLCDIEGNHEENSDYSAYGSYHLVTNPSSDLSTLIVFKSNEIANDTSGANSLGTLVVHGAQLQMSGNIINNYGGGTIPALADHSNDNGLEGESICGNTVSGGTLTNIVAGGGGNSYSQAAALGCSIDVGNSYTINIFPNSNNVNDITSGNAVVATFDHTGDWTLGVTGSSGSLGVQGNLTDTGTGSFTAGLVGTGGSWQQQNASGQNYDAGQFSAGTSTFVGGVTFNVVGGSNLQGTTTFSGGQVEASGTQYYSLGYVNATSTTSSTVINWNNGNVQSVLLQTSTTMTFNNTTIGGRYILALIQDGTGSRLVTWPSKVQWSGGSAPTLTATAGKMDLVTFVCMAVSSTDCYGGANLNYSP